MRIDPSCNFDAMDYFCGSKFWDWNLSWNTDHPQLTPCFEETVLVWIPCAFLFLFSGVDIYGCIKSNTKDIPWGWINISKLIGIAVLLVLTFLDIAYAFVWHPSNLTMYAVDYSTGIIKHVAFIIVKILVILHKKRGIRTSAVLFFFWFFLVVGATPLYISVISSVLQNKNQIRTYPYISNVIYFPTILFLFILELFVDGPPKSSKFPPVKNIPPDARSSFICNVFCCWFDWYAWRFYKKPFQPTDLWNLSYENRLEYLVPLFYKNWNVRAEKVERKSSTKPKLYRERSIQANGYQKCSIPFEQLSRAPKKVSIIPVLWNSFYGTYLNATALKLASDVLMFVSPQILSLLIAFEESNEPMWRGFLYMFALVFNGIIQTTFINNYAYGMFKLGLQIRSTMMAIIFRKALKISNGVRKTFTIGDITNLMSVDAQRFYDLNLYLNMAISAPITILLALYFLWRLIGLSAFAGLAFMIILIPINTIVANKVKELQSLQMKWKDERVKVTTEVLSGIKTLKIYAWEFSFEEKILKLRSEEIRTLTKIAYLNTIVSFVWTTAPYLVSLFTFSVFTLSSDQNILTADIAFVSLSLFNIMKIPISLVPRMFTNIVQTWVACKRINEFLNADELDQLAVTHNRMEPYPLLVENGIFNWDVEDENPFLTNINLRIETGSLVAVVGPVGSGKSSLLSALLGEMNKLEGRVNTKGSIAYVTQQAWLQNATLRDNILFLKPYQKSLYNKVVDSCALGPDFQILLAGDLTEIGDKGVNLSGGQKQRINLARSVYNNADVYLLDDPLSAVDAHVGKHIFENVIGPKGMLRRKTRILVTHAITFLPETDFVIVMKDGTIADSGTYNELLEKQGAFADFISTYSFEEASRVSEEAENLETSAPFKPSTPINRTYERRLSDEEPFSLLSNEEAVLLDEEPPNEHAGERLISEETVEEGKIKLAVYLYYIKSGGILLWLAALAFNILYQAMNIESNLWLTAWSTDPTGSGPALKQVTRKYYYLEIYSLLGLAQVVSAILASLTMYLATTNASDLLHQKLLQKVLKWPAYMFDITPVGRIINRLSFDIDVIDNVFPFNLRQLFILGGTVLSTLYVISYSSPYFIALIIPIACLYIFLQQIYVSVQRQLKRFEAVSRTPVFSLFSETITGAPVIRAYEMQNSFIVESEDRIYRNQISTYPSIEAQRWIGLRLDLTGTFIILFAAFFAVLERGVVNAGILSLSVTYALQITGSLNWTIRSLSDVETNIVSVERIKEFEKSPEENWDSVKHQKTSPSWPQNGEIVFDDFKVRYREGLDLVLRGLSLKIKSEEKVGIVGRTGAGKSSLTISLFRVVEAAGGKILIDGVDISTVDLKTLRSRISIIPQDPVLFSGTIRFNLDPFFEYSDQELWYALELAHLKSFILTLSRGLDYEISENGDNISIGQRQLICLARALLRKTKILILDEATAAIDLETDDLIQKTIRKEFKNCTVLTIAHKLNTVMDSDRILVLDNGLLKEFDTPQKLLASKDSVFYGMAKDAGLVA